MFVTKRLCDDHSHLPSVTQRPFFLLGHMRRNDDNGCGQITAVRFRSGGFDDMPTTPIGQSNIHQNKIKVGCLTAMQRRLFCLCCRGYTAMTGETLGTDNPINPSNCLSNCNRTYIVLVSGPVAGSNLQPVPRLVCTTAPSNIRQSKSRWKRDLKMIYKNQLCKLYMKLL